MTGPGKQKNLSTARRILSMIDRRIGVSPLFLKICAASAIGTIGRGPRKLATFAGTNLISGWP
jgi:hypothetical protein